MAIYGLEGFLCGSQGCQLLALLYSIIFYVFLFFYCLRLRDSFLFGTWHKSTDKDNGGISFGGCGNLSAGLARNLWFMDFVKLQVILAILCEQPFVYRLSTHCRLLHSSE